MAVWGAGMALLEACLLGEEDAAIDMLLRGVACTAELAGFTPLMVRGGQPWTAVGISVAVCHG